LAVYHESLVEKQTDLKSKIYCRTQSFQGRIKNKRKSVNLIMMKQEVTWTFCIGLNNLYLKREARLLLAHNSDWEALTYCVL